LLVEHAASSQLNSIHAGPHNDVLWGAWYRFALERRLPSAAFEPPPGVDAGVLAIERRRTPQVDEADWLAYRAFVGSGFRRGLRTVASQRALKGLRGGVAPRDLDAHQWAELFNKTRGVPGQKRRSGTTNMIV
jgi:23S rRNA (adenine-N6)-dimethyltransferase